MPSSPVVLFVYNRPEHTRKTIECLMSNKGAEKTELYIYSDGAKTDKDAVLVEQVRDILESIKGFKKIEIINRGKNYGLANSIINGVSEILNHFTSIIVMEDDLLSSSMFLDFMQNSLDLFIHRNDIYSVTGYNYPLSFPKNYPHDVYLSYRSSSWGWGTWRDRWFNVDWEIKDYENFKLRDDERELFRRGGEDLEYMLELQMKNKLDSWSIRFDYAHYKNNAFCLHPVVSMIENIGFDGSGVHCGISNEYWAPLLETRRNLYLDKDIQLDNIALKIFNERFRPNEINKIKLRSKKYLSILKSVFERVYR